MTLSFSKLNRFFAFQKFTQTCRDFCEESGIHGLKYFTAQPTRHWTERYKILEFKFEFNLFGWLNCGFFCLCHNHRVWWVIAFILSMILCIFAIASIWRTWNQHPVTVTFDDKITSISSIPFPAFTICTTQKYKYKIDYPNLNTVDLLDALFPNE